MKHTFSKQVKEAISLSREVALQMGDPAIAPGHLALGLLRENNPTTRTVVLDAGLSPEYLVKKLESTLPEEHKPLDLASVPLTKEAETAIRKACDVATISGCKIVETSHLMTALLPYVSVD
jgi:ATP-dependent Clp protease ATP-binding subunit ClpC